MIGILVQWRRPVNPAKVGGFGYVVSCDPAYKGPNFLVLGENLELGYRPALYDMVDFSPLRHAGRRIASSVKLARRAFGVKGDPYLADQGSSGSLASPTSGVPHEVTPKPIPPRRNKEDATPYRQRTSKTFLEIIRKVNQ
jgi:hypothetical protein